MPNELDTKAGELGKDEILDFLMEEDDEVVEEKEPEKKEEKKEEKEEGKEEVKEDEEEIKLIDEEKEEEPEEELDIKLQGSRKQLLKDFPELFKKHPWVEKVIYRNNAYTEIFPTVEDAKEASEATEMLDQFRTDLMSGNIETTLNTIKQNDKDAFAKVVDNYLPQLARVDRESYYHVCANVIKTLTLNMVKEARASKSDHLETAAAVVNKYMFGSDEFTPPVNLSKTDSEQEEKTKLQKEREDFQREKYESVSSDLDRRVESVLRGTITEHIDPKNAMTDYVKKNAVREAHESLEDLIRQDTTFVAHLNRLWERAMKENLSKASLDSIRSAYLSKARTLLPSVIKKARVEALRGLGKKTSETEETKDKRGPITPGRSASQNSGKIKNARDIPRNMSTLDFLSSDD